jgi:excisionase family DNA binding protein
MNTSNLAQAGSDAGEIDEDRMFLTAEEVGRYLGLRRSRVYELAAGGRLPAVRLGRRILFPRRGLDALVKAAMDRVQPEAPGTGSPADWLLGHHA